jgi:amino acid adenylation domain-containing protein/non-ribosomal peptide synthase protein (TIGR01720 family)
MSRKNIENIYSLSPMQQGLLFHSLVASQEASYPVQIDWTLRGNLDEAAFLRAWQEVVDRHPILRTAFVWERLEKPMQIVRKRILIPVEQRDLREMPAADQKVWVTSYAADECNKSFDLTRAPLMRLSLLRLSDDTYRFIWSLHHLIIDGWSLPLLVKEVFALYAAYSTGKEPRLDRVKPFGDYIGWLNKQSLSGAETFWKRTLAGFVAPTPFRVDHPVKEGEAHEVDETMLVFSAAESASLQAFARQHQLTLSTLVQGAWALLLARYSGEDDVLFGATVSGRSAPVPGIDRMVGLFINTLPVRVKVPAEQPIVAWLAALQDQYSELREYEYSPLVEVQGWSEVPRGLPLFESQVAFENYPEAEALLQGAGGLTVDKARMETRTHYPLTVVAVFQKILMVRISSDRRRFELPVVERMLQHLKRLLAGMLEQPTARVGELPLLTDDEKHRVVVTWNESAVAFANAQHERVDQLFDARADATPDALALVAGGARLTYRELETQANRLAHHLQTLGVGPDAVVGLSMGRTAEIIVGLLGILKAGGAYVPIDPAYPPARIAQIVEDAGVRVIVTLGEFAAAMPATNVTVVRLDDDAAELAAASDARPTSAATASNLAYVLFTSGSTGKPKGVAIEHRQLVNYVRGVASKLALPEDASYAHISTFSADLGNTVLFPPLCLGGTLHVIPQDLTTDPNGLAEYFARERIDCLKIVPSHLAALLSASHPERLIPRRLLVLGGEGSSWDLIARIAKLAPDCRILNHYGPTETTVGVLTYPVDPTRPAPTAIVPLGRPLPNSRIYVLDPRSQPTPVGVPGEVYIGGDGVARGYLNRPDLTDERFVPDPFGAPGSRLYRTGDRARTLPDGTICFLGRIDFQVKIRGFRIELGEIEAAVQAHPAVAEIIVLAQEEASGDKRLVAYLVPSAGSIDVPELRASLGQRLPEYMIPAAFVVLDALPLTSNGKIDRRALPALESSKIEEAAIHVGPRNPVEEVLAGIWSDVFDRPEISVHDRFSDLGGHSLLAIQIIARTREAFQAEIPLRAIFEHPTIAALAEAVQASMREEEGLAAPPIEKVSRESALRLSFAQERLWFLDQLEPGSAFYNVPSGLRIKGPLDAAALERALREIIRRHEVLRTTFTSFEGRPTQVIHESIAFTFPIDLVGPVPAAERDAVVRRHAEQEAARPFDLITGPLVRARLVELDGDDHLLLLTLHHIVSDGWTRGIFNRELTTLYTAFLADKPSPLPELTLQYADYAAWQRGWLAGEILDRQIAYWKKQLTGAPQAIELPTDRPRPPVQRYRGGQRITVLSADIAKSLKDLARREGVTLYMTLLAALDVLLHRYTGQDDVVVGTSISNRGHADTERMIGFFINALVLRTELSGDLTFLDLLARVRDVCLGAYAHQDMPFERLVQELQPEPDPSRSPLFQVIFTMQNAPVSAIDLSGLQLRPVKAESATVKYDLTFVMGETPGGLGVSIEYNTDLFDAATIERMLGHLATLLEGVAKSPDRRLGDLPLLRDEERQRLLGAWNDTAATFSTDEAIHELFEAQVDATPDRMALVAGLDRLTFGELDRRANRLAHHLRARGVGPESVVGLAVSRSAGMIVGLLAILKAGGAYVPLDPAYPASRLADILGEARSTVVVTEGRFAASLPEGVRVVRLDDDAAAILAESAERPESAVTAQNLAYVLFTSGSTGKPKGVAIEHRQLVNYVRGVMTRLDLGDDASYAHVSTFSADLGNTVLFPPLVSGGCLHVIAEELTTNPNALAEYFTHERIDCLKIVPSHLAALLSAAHPERILPKKLLVLGGEASTWELVARLEKLAPAMRILNHYGPTETTVGVLTYAVEKGHPAASPIVPLGRPLPNSRVYVLDARRELSPVGVPGEVYIGGDGVARGYLNRPDLTAERFVADPFGPAGSRLYRTGDRARTLPDGALVFLGRIDHQVKIRGYRIELGEIESALATDAGVAEAVVLAPEDRPGDRRLVAYVVLRDGAAIGDVKSRLGERLPEYMVPGSFVAIATIPLTPNGKIDRRALAASEDRAEGATEDGYAPPRNPVEEVLTAIWTDVFDRERIGIHERFSDLGGHSLLAIQIVARARDAFQTSLALRAIFESPTIAGLAERIEESIREDEGAVVPPIRRAPREQPLRLSFAQERLWFLDQLEPGSASYNIPAAIRLVGALDALALERALATIYRRHEVLRTSFTAVDGHPTQVIHADATLRFLIQDLGEMLADDREAAMRAEVAAEAALPFDLARGPLFRARLIRLGVDEHVLLYTMHHIVSDAWTRGILNRELAALYEAFQSGRPSPLPDLPIQYADYAEWQRSWLDGEALGRQLAYWKKHLEGAPSSIDLPTDRPRPPVQTFRGERRFFELSPELTRGLKDLSRREGATLFMTLLAAFDVLLHRYSGQSDLVVGTPILNRTRQETEGLIGFFLNTLAIRAEITPELTFQELLGRVREACLGAYGHQDMPFERLVTELSPERDLSRSPLFQVMFTLQNAPGEAPRLGGLRLSPVSSGIATSKFDLTLGLGEGRGGLLGSFEYNSDLFDQSTIDRMIEHLRTLLEGVVENAERPVVAIPILGAMEREHVLRGLNATHVEHPKGRLIHQIFEAQADATPDAIALVFEDQSLTYREVDGRANQLAHALRKRGVGPDVLVGVCLDRSLELVIALYAVLKAGGAYVPLDPEYPKDRLAFMVEDARVPVLLTQAHVEAALPPHGAQVIRLDTGWDEIAKEPDSRLDRGDLGLANLAYVIYTSGSTGRPKGAMNEHRGVLNRLQWMQSAHGLTGEDRVLQKTPFSFDVSVWEFFWPLMFGATLVVAKPEGHKDPAYLADLVEAQRITTMHFVPSMLKVFTDELATSAPRARCGSLKRVFASGEALLPTIVDGFAARLPGAALHNLYGPTEAAVDVTAWECKAGSAIVPIGKPIDNVRIYLLDDRREPVPVGIRGELYIGGVQVARGYLNRVELTADRFVADPFVPEEGYPLYRTGDVARWLPNGEIEYLGRVDHQVKIRGFRIELGEIEAALAEHPATREVVVVAREDRPGDKRLVAYLACVEGPAPTVGDLRSFLKDTLPDYMVPAAFIVLAELPLTSSGKIDRRALPAPEDADRLDTGEAFVAPRSDVEATLCRIWAGVLRVEQVGVHDNFFEIGGDSILSIQIVARAQQAGLSITPRQLFQHQTVAELAEVAGTTRALEAEQGLVTGSVEPTPVQRWWLELAPEDPQHWNQSTFLEMKEPVDAAILEAVLGHLIAHHDALRLRLTRGSEGVSAVISAPQGPVPMITFDLRDAPEAAIAASIEKGAAEAQASLDLESGPLLRAVLWKLAPTSADRLLIVIHHLAVDGVSWRILLDDLWTAYGQLARGEAIQLAPKTTSFKRWSERLVEEAAIDAAVDEEAYWLSPARQHAARVPVDRAEAANTEGSVRHVVLALTPAETESLLREVPEAYQTQINDVLLAAFAQAASAWTRSPNILVDVEGHGREDTIADVDVTRTVGWFTTVYPVLIELPPDAAPGRILTSVKEQLRAIPRRGLGYGLLRYLRGGMPSLALEAMPAAEISFNYLGQIDQALPESGTFVRARESSGPPHSLRARRRYLLDVAANISAGALRVRFAYSEARHDKATIERLAEGFLAALRALITHAISPEAGGYTPADFPRATLSQEFIDALAARDPGARGRKKTIDDIYPLSPMQQGLLFHTLVARDTGTYVVHLGWTIRGQLDVAAFTRAFDEVANRHPILRTAFLWERLERPIQVVRKRVQVPVILEDLRELGPEAQAARIVEVAEADRSRPFDLAEAPLMRLTFLRLADDAYRFYWSRHHLVMDGWSTPIVLREVFALYDAYAVGKEARLERVRPYGDYIAWIGAQDTAKTEAFWRAQLKGFREPTPLGIEKAALPGEIEEFEEQRFVLPEAISGKLASFGRQHQLTMSTVVQGAWALLLARYSGEDDVLFGATVSGRSAPVTGVDRMVGLFINTLAVRVAVDREAHALAWLKALQEQQAELREYEHTPLVHVQGWSEMPRGTPLFESLVVFENYPVEESLKQGVRGLEILDARTTERPPYPLTVLAAFRRTLLVRVAYDRRRFDAPAVERLLGHLRALLEGIAAHPDVRLGELGILSADERQELIHGLNDTDFTQPPAACLSDVFEAQVDATPDAIALVFEEKMLTYRELDRRANQLARALVKRGVGPEVLVGVCLDRSLEMVVALYGVLKAGGAYVPLDPEYPQDRLAFMLDDTKVPVVLTQAHLAGVLPAHGAQVIRLDTEWDAIANEPGSRPERAGITPDSLAYVIYTSGSTGRPKGAMNAHRGVLNRLFWMQRAYGLTPGDRVLQKTPFSFDVSVWEFFWPLMFGARLVIARPEGHKDPGYLAGLIQAAAISTMHFVPSMLTVFLDDAASAGCTSLRRVFCSGEALPPPLVDAFFARLGATELHNLYGPTEAAVDVTYFECKPGLPVIPIGRPVDNTSIYLLDASGSPVPRGVRGELYIGGVQVGRGYLNRAELTAERFLPDPFRGDGARMYRTGDVARWLPDGNVEYLGRADFQVKIRGFRIELGEIESALLRHGMVREVVVVAREDRPGDKRLVAYLVCAEGPAPSVGELRAFLKETLPDYMLPAAFVVQLALPLTASGKIDRRALPAPDEGARLATGEAFVAPRDRAEEELCRIWASVLRLPHVGVHDNFFEIGGDSILSIQIVSRAQLAGLSITPRQVFEHPTVAELAAVAGSRAAVSAEQGAVTGTAPLTPVQQWFLELAPEDPGHWNQMSFLEAKEPLDAAALEFAVSELVRHHDALRLRVTTSGADRAQEFAPPGVEAPFRRVDLTDLGDADSVAAIEKTAIETQSSLDLAAGPVLRVVLFDLGPARPSRLLFVIHHLAVDGVSWRILLEDLWTAYGQRRRGEAIALPPKTTSFKRWAEELAEHAKSPMIRGESDYWLAPERGATHAIPVDHERGENDERSVRAVVASLSADETESLLRDVPEAYRTQINDVLLTAFAQVLGSWTGTPGARVDLEGHGREEIFADADITRTVGWFTAVFPVVIDLPESQAPGEALKSVKEQLRALPGRGLGYGMLRYLGERGVADELRAAPQSGVMFNYLGQRDQALPEDSPFRWARESSGPSRSPRARRRYLLDVNATIAEGRLHVRWIYSENRHEKATIEDLARRYTEALSALIAHCVSPEARGVTPSDFQDAGLSQEALDMLVGVVDDDDLS